MPLRADFSDPSLARRIISPIEACAARVTQARFMEVCGTHTMEIGRLGIRSLLPKNIELVSGPGCPVCVTPGSYIDAAVRLSVEHGAILVTFGDMVRVPGTATTLEWVRSTGRRVEVVSGPLRAVEIACENPGTDVVFLAVGFETTTPTVAQAVLTAASRAIGNLSFLCSQHLVPPALDALLSDPSLGLTGFILPGHVSAIIGARAYQVLVARDVPGVIAGFEPVDILSAILELLRMQASRTARVVNLYGRVVRPEGNSRAREIVDRVFQTADSPWRGIGMLPRSGLAMRAEYARFDAAVRFGLDITLDVMPAGCSCGEVLKGRIPPVGCPLFGKECVPEHPVGPCMVSNEGSCAAYHRYEIR